MQRPVQGILPAPPKYHTQMASQGHANLVPTWISDPNLAVFSVPALGNTNKGMKKICVYGDSLTAGFSPQAGVPFCEPYANSLVSTLAALGVSAQVVGCGLCSLTAVDMVNGLDSPQLPDGFGRMGMGLGKLLADHGPFDLVIIMAGTNDLGNRHLSAQEVLGGLKRMHEACWKSGSQTLALSIPQSAVTATMQYPEAKAKQNAVNSKLKEWAQTKPCTYFVDTAMLLPFDHAACACRFWDADSLHFTAAGSREFGCNLVQFVAGSHGVMLNCREPLPVIKDRSRKKASSFWFNFSWMSCAATCDMGRDTTDDIIIACPSKHAAMQMGISSRVPLYAGEILS
eukprot:gnl/MRDRNA2_/MRDRNA2_19360_c0_seq1.p1 gnl/MRDRNA2_/MRDRNA2_19360_c0~~gnl/MRDRNA2_/MRDRNA2_19360_c0_seq1.p1  ORF type:complete len:342 (+),score=54.19 gnl/MRDRNA2_/MRDRNA2_19360_c0_seq1:78-1103(+)